MDQCISLSGVESTSATCEIEARVAVLVLELCFPACREFSPQRAVRRADCRSSAARDNTNPDFRARTRAQARIEVGALFSDHPDRLGRMASVGSRSDFKQKVTNFRESAGNIGHRWLR
jgi:hypothetical protein